ncbi:MAG: OmpA family protein [Methyloligellaceae bacterium]
MAEALADCRKVDTELRSAISERAVERFPGLHKRLLTEPTCDGAYRGRVGRVLALATLKQLQEEIGSAKGPFPLKKLELAASFGKPWQVMNALGDALYANEDWAAAVKAYEVAIDDIRDTGANPKAPPQTVELKLAKRTYQARALAPIHVATRRFRGRPSGLADPQFRNFKAEAVPVPIRFASGKTTMTRGSQDAAHDIFEFLKDRGAKKVRLVGHTDPRGSQSKNVKLSKARAAAVMAYLVEKGFKGEIEVVGKGASQRYEPDDAFEYTDAQRNAFDRRVEYLILK